MSTERTRAVVVGGGLAGLASAVELRTRGLDVTIIDRNDHLGGKMNVLQESGFSFDMGPTILTMPQVIRGITERTGRTVSDYVDIADLGVSVSNIVIRLLIGTHVTELGLWVARAVVDLGRRDAKLTRDQRGDELVVGHLEQLAFADAVAVVAVCG